MFKKLDRVMLLSGKYKASSDNPAIGSEFQCVGTITSVNRDGASVSWDNLYNNSYYTTDLIYEHEVNIALLCKSIW